MTPSAGRKRRPLLRTNDLYSAVWLVFLAFPVAEIALLSTAGLGWDLLGYLGLALFGIAYVLIFRPINDLEGEGRMPGVPPQHRIASIGTLVLLGCASLTVPSLGVNVMNIAPFFAALWMWSLPIRPALFTSVLWWAITVATGWVWTGELSWFIAIGPTMAMVFLTLFRLFAERSMRDEILTTELAKVSEREEISRDVHDLLGHSLTAVSLKAQVARKLLRQNPDRAEAELDELLELTQKALAEVRGVVGRMRTPDLASQVVAARTALSAAEIELTVCGNSSDVLVNSRALFAWAVREGCTNIARHSGATHATIRFTGNRLEISDDGIGYDAREGHGLTGLRRRAADVGATVNIHRANPANTERPGTMLTVEYPE